LTSYNGPREIRVSSDDPKLKQDLDRLVADSVRAQPPVRRSVVRWQKSVPVSLDSTVICFVPSAGDTMVLPRPLPVDDGRTIVIAVATGSGVLTVEAPRGASVTKVGESADIRTLEQPGAYTFTVIDGVYYVATAISGSIPPTIITEAMEIQGPALVGRSETGTGATTAITATGGLEIVNPDNTLIISSSGVQTANIADGAVTYSRIQDGPGYSVLAVENSATADWAPVTAAFAGGVLQRVTAGTVQFALLNNDNFPDTGGSSPGIGLAKIEASTAGVLGQPIVGNTGRPTNIEPSTSGQVLLGDANAAATAVFWGNIGTAQFGIDYTGIAADFVIGGVWPDMDVFALDGDIVKTSAGSYDRLSIAAGAVDTTEIADEAVTRAKLADFGRYLCAVTNSTDQSFTAASGNQTVNWFSELSDDDALHSTASNTGRITIPGGGLWEIAWDFYATQAGTLSFFRDGTTQISDGYAVAANTVNSGVIKRNIPSSGYIEMVFDINTNGTSSGPSCTMTVTSLAL
jgi:hypothetical protein